MEIFGTERNGKFLQLFIQSSWSNYKVLSYRQNFT